MSTTSKRGQTAGSRKTQFGKGRSGNPRGRPPKPARFVPKHIRDAAAAAAREQVSVRQGTKTAKLMKLELLLQRAIDHGIREGGKAALDVIRMLESLIGQAYEPLVDPLVQTPEQIWNENMDRVLEEVARMESSFRCEPDDDRPVSENENISRSDYEESRPAAIDPNDEFYRGMINKT